MRFTDAHSSSGICTPSRYALLTGRYHWRDFHDIVKIMEPSVFDVERLTLPEMLRRVGYFTAAIGKWHLGWDWEALLKPGAGSVVLHEGTTRDSTYLPDALDWTRPIPDGPLAHGFDHYFGDDVINFPPYTWIRDDRVVEAPDAMFTRDQWFPLEEGTLESRPGPMREGWDPYAVLPCLAEEGVAFIRSRKDQEQPFFLYFALPSPHAPIIPNAPFVGKSQAGPYGDFVFQSDSVCGQILEALEAAGLADNTLVLFTSDNGPEHFAYARAARYDHASAGPFRGLKRDIYEGGHRVPMIVRWPGRVEAGRISHALVSQIDWMATLAAILEVELPADAAEDSDNLLPILTGQAASVRTEHVHNTFADKFALRQGDWVLIDAADGYHNNPRLYQDWLATHGYPPDDDLPVELYHLPSDPGQRLNRASDHPERVRAMRQRLADLRRQPGSVPRALGRAAALDSLHPEGLRFTDYRFSPTCAHTSGAP